MRAFIARSSDFGEYAGLPPILIAATSDGAPGTGGTDGESPADFAR